MNNGDKVLYLVNNGVPNSAIINFTISYTSTSADSKINIYVNNVVNIIIYAIKIKNSFWHRM